VLNETDVASAIRPHQMAGPMKRRGPCKFKQRDVVRAVRAARAAGVVIGRVDIDLSTGKISIISADDSVKDNPLDKWVASRGGGINAPAA
jgi:hypothetical protein